MRILATALVAACGFASLAPLANAAQIYTSSDGGPSAVIVMGPHHRYHDRYYYWDRERPRYHGHYWYRHHRDNSDWRDDGRYRDWND
jgi:hypothetical protein